MKTSQDVLVLFSFKVHKHRYNITLFERLYAAGKRQSLTLCRGAIAEAHMRVVNNKLTITESLTRRDVSSFGLVYFELWQKTTDMALAIALYAQRHGTPFFSEELTHVAPKTKIGDMAVLADNGVPLPDTFISSSREIKKQFKTNPPLQYPLVVKAADGFGGKDNFLVHNYEMLREVLDDNKAVRFVVQEFIPNDCDYRCLVLGGEVALVLRRSRATNSNTHLNNTSQGGEGVVLPVESLSPEVRADVVTAARLVNRSKFAGVDLIFNMETGRHYILEVNQAPQIETGAEIEKKMDALLGYMKVQLKKGSNND